jgi:hypothetical protein
LLRAGLRLLPCAACARVSCSRCAVARQRCCMRAIRHASCPRARAAAWRCSGAAPCSAAAAACRSARRAPAHTHTPARARRDVTCKSIKRRPILLRLRRTCPHPAPCAPRRALRLPTHPLTCT